MKLLKLSLIAFAVLGLSLGFQSCKSVKEVALNQLGGEWTLKTLNGEDVSEGFKGATPSIQFNLTDRQVSGSGGCNRYTGGFILDKGKFSAPNLASTMMMCVAQNKEDQFLKALSTPSTLSINKVGNLVLSQNGKEVIVFEKSQGINTADLAGIWTLTMIENKSASSLFPTNPPTIEFKDGRVGGNGGCNRYNGKYSLEVNALSVGPLMSTRMACDQLAGETKFTQLLEGDSKIVIEGNKLKVVKGGNTVLIFAK